MMFFHQNSARKTTLKGAMFHICIIFYPSYGSIYYVYKTLQTHGLLDLMENIAVAGSFLHIAFLHIVVYYTLQDTIISLQQRMEELYELYNPIQSLQISRLWITGILITFIGVNGVLVFTYYAMYMDYEIVAYYVGTTTTILQIHLISLILDTFNVI